MDHRLKYKMLNYNTFIRKHREKRYNLDFGDDYRCNKKNTIH